MRAFPLDLALWRAARAAFALGALLAATCLIEGRWRVAPAPNSFGALVAVLVCLPGNEIARPWRIFASHALSLTAGVTMRALFPPSIEELAPIAAAATAVFLMSALDVIHPPAGAVAMWSASFERGEWSAPSLGLAILAACGIVVAADVIFAAAIPNPRSAGVDR